MMDLEGGHHGLVMACPGNMGAPGRPLIWCPFKPMFFKLFSALDKAGEHFLGLLPEFRIIFRKIISYVVNVSLPASYFRLFQ
jgi:hypothetical protein